MDEKLIYYLLFGYSVLIGAFIITYLAMGAKLNNRYEDATDTNDVTKQMADYWEAFPLIDIVVKNANNEKCPQDYHSVFSRMWKGTYEGCDCRGVLLSDGNEGTISFFQCTNQQIL